MKKKVFIVFSPISTLLLHKKVKTLFTFCYPTGKFKMQGCCINKSTSKHKVETQFDFFMRRVKNKCSNTGLLFPGHTVLTNKKLIKIKLVKPKQVS